MYTPPLPVCALSARAPRSTRTRVFERRHANARSELVSERDAFHLSAILVVADVEGHRRGVHVIEIVETVAGGQGPDRLYRTHTTTF